MKKKSIVCGAFIFVLILSEIIVFFRPRPLISLPYTISNAIETNSDVCIVSVYFNGNKIAEKFNEEMLLDVLSKYTCRPVAGSWTHSVEGAWEINLIQGGKSLHIVVGDFPFCYLRDGSYYEIIKSDSLWREIDSIVTMPGSISSDRKSVV